MLKYVFFYASSICAVFRKQIILRWNMIWMGFLTGFHQFGQSITPLTSFLIILVSSTSSLPPLHSSLLLGVVVQRFTDFHAGPVHSSEQSDQHQENEKCPGCINALIFWCLPPWSGNQSCSRYDEDQAQQEAYQTPLSRVPLANRWNFSAVWTASQCPICKFCPQKSVSTVATGNSGTTKLRIRTPSTGMNWT